MKKTGFRKKVKYITVLALAAMALSTSLCAAGPKVVILLEPELFNFGGQPTLMPQKIKPLLESFGIDAVEITADQMNDASYFNTDRFSMIIMLYGNAFPLVGYDNLKKFHADGGALVVNGIPFSHPAERVGDK